MRNIYLRIWAVGVASALSDTFRFNQCECAELEFFSEQRNNFLHSFTIFGDLELFQCPGSLDFPDEAGVILQLGTSLGSLRANQVSVGLFQDIFTGERKAWHAAFRLTFSPALGANFGLIQVMNRNKVVYSSSVSILTIGGIKSARIEMNREILDFEVSSYTNPSLDIIVGETFDASINGGLRTFDAGYVCASFGGDTFRCNFIDGVMTSLSEASIDIFQHQRESTLMPVTISMLLFDDDGITSVQGNNEQEFLNKLAARSSTIISQDIPPAISIPVAVHPPLVIQANKNEDLGLDLSSLLSSASLDPSLLQFWITKQPVHGTLTGSGSSSEFKYTPDSEFIGLDTFTFSYGVTSPFECSNTLAQEVFVKNTENPPIAQDSFVDVFASVPQIITEFVAKDIDETDNKMNGKFVVSSDIEGAITKTCNDQTSASELTVTNGIVSFCYTPISLLVDGRIESLIFEVVDEVGLSDNGVMSFKGNSPIALASENPVLLGFEDSRFSFFLGNDKFGRMVKHSQDEVSMRIRITKLPDTTLGVLLDSNNIPVDVTTNGDFSDEESLRFVPNENVFNAFGGTPIGPSGDSIGRCQTPMPINDLGKFCEISFEYKIFFDEVETEAQRAFFLIEAVDDGKPILSSGNRNIGGMTTLRSSTEFELSSSLIFITSDAGANAFQIRMQILGLGGILFRINLPENSLGLTFSQKSTSDSDEDCTQGLCAAIILLGTPVQLEEVVERLHVEVSGELSQSFLSLEVVQANTEFGSGSKIFVPVSVTSEQASKNRSGIGICLAIVMITYCYSST